MNLIVKVPQALEARVLTAICAKQGYTGNDRKKCVADALADYLQQEVRAYEVYKAAEAARHAALVVVQQEIVLTGE